MRVRPRPQEKFFAKTAPAATVNNNPSPRLISLGSGLSFVLNRRDGDLVGHQPLFSPCKKYRLSLMRLTHNSGMCKKVSALP